METYRFRGHSMSDPAKYRTKDEVNTFKNDRDPITQIKDLILKSGDYSEDDIKAIDKDIKAIVAEAADFAQQSPEPDPSELWTDILLDTKAEA